MMFPRNSKGGVDLFVIDMTVGACDQYANQQRRFQHQFRLRIIQLAEFWYHYSRLHTKLNK
jgi:hypothetical protein